MKTEPSSPEVFIIAFARLPVPGKVKTRLAASCGNDAACSIYEACLTHCLQESVRTGYKVLCACSEEEEVPFMERWMRLRNLEVQVITQDQAKDLGTRLKAAAKHVLRATGSRVIILGTDVPDITAEVLRNANTELNENDISLGPSLDGGYYLIALRKSHDCLFTNIPWSTSTVYQETVERAKAAELKFEKESVLPQLRDIDYLEDLAAWVREGRGTTQESHLMWERAVAVVTRH